MDAFHALGGQVASNPADVGRDADVVFVMVVDAKQTESVACGDNGLLTTMKPGSVIVITATIGKATTQSIERHASAKNVHVIDCPVVGRAGRR